MNTSKQILWILASALSMAAFGEWVALSPNVQTPTHGTGYVHSKRAPAVSSFHAMAIPEDMPWDFDWRDLQGGLTPIKDQGGCGSCWAFGTTAALEQAIKIRLGQTVSLSEQEIVSCSNYGSCLGGNFANGYQQSPGQSLTSEFPYRAMDVRCKSGLSHQWKIKSWGYVGAQGRAPSVDELKAAIMQYGAVTVTVYADNNFQRYKSGIFNTCSNGTTNHMVALVGWNDIDQVWYLRNSWGTSWGEQGYMRIKWNCSRVGEEATYVDVETAN